MNRPTRNGITPTSFHAIIFHSLLPKGQLSISWSWVTRSRIPHIRFWIASIALYSISTCLVILLSGCVNSSLITPNADNNNGNPNIQPTLTLTTSATPSSYGATITLAATISNGPTGVVTFSDSHTPIGTGAIDNNSATLSTNLLLAGTHTITAVWPGEGGFASVTSNAVLQVVDAVTPVLSWPTPAPITYGTPLSSTQLDASAGNVAGSFSYSPAAGAIPTAGPQTLSTTFSPTDSDDFTATTLTTQITVNKATPIITWPAPPPITYGTALSGNQLDASSSLPGQFVFSPPLGTVLSAGTQTLTVTFTPTDSTDYNNATATVLEDIVQPTLTVTAPATSLLAGSSYLFTATESGSTIQAVQWAVNGIVGGDEQVGTITSGGAYTAPNTSIAAVTITASLQANPAIQGSVVVQVIGPTSAPGTIGFAFTLPTSAATSAGVYDSSGNLIKTLWSNQTYPAGPQTATWDGTDDAGASMPSGSYQVRVLFNNVKYTWGEIGNTSTSWTGIDSWDMQGVLPVDMAIIGSTAYVANQYAEQRPNASSFPLPTPQQPSVLFSAGQCYELHFVTTDGHLLYFANTGNGWGGSVAFIMAFDPTASQYYSFPLGEAYNAPYGQIDCGTVYPTSVIDYVAPTSAGATGGGRTNISTGIAVQTNGQLLAVSHGAAPESSTLTSVSQDIIRLFNKTSGAQLGVINLPNPQRLAFAPNGDLWAITAGSVVRISSVGNQNTIAVQLTGLSAPIGIAVDPSTSDVLVTDGGISQQVKRFSQSGQLISTYGDLGGYTDCNPTVTNSRLFLDSTAGPGYVATASGYTSAFLSVLPDSSFWVGDPGNARILHISSNGTYIEEISFLRFLYHVAVDHRNPARVFAEDLEYAVDYTKPLVPGDPDPERGGNGSWSLVRNWFACLPTNADTFLRQVQTFPNGQTYASVVNTANGMEYLAQLPSSGPMLLSTRQLEYGSWNPNVTSFTHNFGLSFWLFSLGNETQAAYQQDFLGYDVSLWPQWGAPYLIGSVPITDPANPYGSADPIGANGWGMLFWPEPTSSGVLVTYNTSPSTPPDHHLGGVPLGGTNWSWKVSPGANITVPDGQGTFPDNNSFGGHNGIAALVEGSNVFEGYDGQAGTFSSQWMHWNDDGLLIGQFGHPENGLASDGTLWPGAAGNIQTMSTVSANGNIYLYNSDEGYHPGIHQWTVSGLDTIREMSGSASLGGTVIVQ